MNCCFAFLRYGLCPDNNLSRMTFDGDPNCRVEQFLCPTVFPPRFSSTWRRPGHRRIASFWDRLHTIPQSFRRRLRCAGVSGIATSGRGRPDQWGRNPRSLGSQKSRLWLSVPVCEKSFPALFLPSCDWAISLSHKVSFPVHTEVYGRTVKTHRKIPLEHRAAETFFLLASRG